MLTVGTRTDRTQPAENAPVEYPSDVDETLRQRERGRPLAQRAAPLSSQIAGVGADERYETVVER